MSHIWVTATRSQLTYYSMHEGKHMRIKREIDRRQLIELGGHLVNTEACLVFISHNLYIPKCRKKGEANGFFLTKIQRTNLLNIQNIK